MKSPRLHFALLLSLLLLGLGLRLFVLEKNPVGFFCDEAAIGYNAYIILTNGTDEYGVPFPTFFRSFGEYKSPIAIYAAVPFIQLLGLTEFSTRLQSVVFGMITIVMVYFLTKELFTKHIALLSTAITATMPWLIHYNRTGFEMNSYTAFFTAMIFFLVKATKHKQYIIPASLIVSLSLYTYYSAKLIVPLFVIGFFIIYHKKLLLHKKELLSASLLIFLLSIPFIISFINGEGTARFYEVSIFTAQLSATDTLIRMLNNYFMQLSPTFFLQGEPTFITRHFTGGLTPLLTVTIPFLYIGMGYAMFLWKKTQGKLLLLWLLLYPIGAAVVAEGPFTGRTIMGAPMSALFIALGITVTVRFAKQYMPQVLVGGAIGVLLVLNVIQFTQFYFQKYPLSSADFWGWQYGPKEIVAYFEDQKQQYEEFYMIGEFNAPHIFFKFYAPHGCETCQIASPHEVYTPTKRQLFAVSERYLQTHTEIKFTTKKTLYYPNGNPAFIIGEVHAAPVL